MFIRRPHVNLIQDNLFHASGLFIMLPMDSDVTVAHEAPVESVEMSKTRKYGGSHKLLVLNKAPLLLVLFLILTVQIHSTHDARLFDICFRSINPDDIQSLPRE